MKQLKTDGPIHTDNGWMTRRMAEVVNAVPGCSAEIRPVEGDDGRWCDLMLYYEDDAARERMYDAMEPLVGEFDEFLSILDRRHDSGSN